MSARSFEAFLLAAAVVVGCSDDAETSGGGSGGRQQEGGGGEGGGPPAAEVSVHFFVDARPHDADDAEVEATDARYSDPVRVVVRGLEAGQRIRVDTSLGSWATFDAINDGTVDLGRDAPIEGTWTEADVDGLIWSAPPTDDYEAAFDVTVVDATSGAPLAAGSFARISIDAGVEATPVAEGTRVGTLVRPTGAARGKRPAVLAFGGSEGGTSTGEFFAYHLAQLGYVSFGVGYFGAPGLPADLERVPLEILEDDLAFLASQPDVDPDHIAVLGGSRGGELALLLGASFPERVHAVVAQVPSGYVWGATSGEPVTAWTLGGVDVPSVPSAGAFPDSYFKDGEQYIVSTPTFFASIDAATPEELDLATTRVEDASGPVLLLAGASDNLWPSCDLADVAWQRLDASGHAALHEDEVHCFPDAGHFIVFPPGTSTQDSTAYFNAAYDVWFDVGGTPEGNARAARAGNTALRGFLERALGAGAPPGG